MALYKNNKQESAKKTVYKKKASKRTLRHNANDENSAEIIAAKPQKIDMQPLPKVAKIEDTASMKPSKEKVFTQRKSAPEKRSFKVIEGFKKKNFRRRIIRYSVCLAIVAALLITQLSLPTGISEALQNAYASLGSGENPAELQSNNVKSMKVSGKNSYVLSDTFYEIFNKNNKQVLFTQHGFSNPDFKLSASRAVLFDRGGYGIKIINDYEVLVQETFDELIYSADISRSGKAAVVTKPIGYAAAITVYNKGFKKINTYYSNDNLIADVCLNNSGKTAAFAEVYTENGIAKTKICTYNVKNSKLRDSYVIDGVVVSSLTNLGRYFVAISDKGYWFFDWRNCSSNNSNITGEIIYYDVALNGKSVFVTANNSDYSSNTVRVYSKTGKELSNFTVDNVVSDVSFNKGQISFLLGNEVLVYSQNGEKLKTIDCGYNTYHIASLGHKKISAISKSHFYVFK